MDIFKLDPKRTYPKSAPTGRLVTLYWATPRGYTGRWMEWEDIRTGEKGKVADSYQDYFICVGSK